MSVIEVLLFNKSSFALSIRILTKYSLKVDPVTFLKNLQKYCVLV